jgi:hypothetical protein
MELSGNESGVSLTLVVLVVVVASASSGIATAAMLSYSETVAVSFGEVSQEPSDLDITDVSYAGPGNSVETVEVTVENTAETDLSADVEVVLLDGNREVATGTVSGEQFASGQTATVSIDLDRTTSRSEFDDTDVKVEET